MSAPHGRGSGDEPVWAVWSSAPGATRAGSRTSAATPDQEQRTREARVVPNFVDGQTNGFKVFAIRCDSGLSQIGVKNNDVVVTNVNGHDLPDPGKALETYEQLQDETSFTVHLLRDGEPMVLTWERPSGP